MILYLHEKLTTPPPWIDPDIANLCRRATPQGVLFGVGDPLLFDLPANADWSEVGDGWMGCRSPHPFNPDDLLRVTAQDRADLDQDKPLTARLPVGPEDKGIPGGRISLIPVSDGDMIWAAPMVLGNTGQRAFNVHRGAPNWTPRLTACQSRLLAIAADVRAEFEAANLREPKSLMPGQEHILFSWATEALSAVYALTPYIIAEFGLMSDRLVYETLRALSGFSMHLYEQPATT